MKPITITIPGTFDKSLSANQRHKTHWAVLHPHKKDLIERTMKALEDAGVDAAGIKASWARPLHLDWTIYWEKGRRGIDDDNALPGVKSARDAIAIYLSIDDKEFRSQVPTQIAWAQHKGEGRIVVEIAPDGYWIRVPRD